MTEDLGCEKRSSRRFELTVPLLVQWQEPNGKKIEEPGTATEVSANGAIIDMARFPSPGIELTLIEKTSQHATRARVVRVQDKAARTGYRVVVHLVHPGDRFWGLDFRLKKSTADLAELEQALTSGNTDPQVLREFRDAVDYVRKAAWVVQEWQERKSQSHDVSTILPLLMLERIRRTTQLCKVIRSELRRHEGHEESLGIAELSDALDGLRAELHSIRNK
jgi:hypothetical protein